MTWKNPLLFAVFLALVSAGCRASSSTGIEAVIAVPEAAAAPTTTAVPDADEADAAPTAETLSEPTDDCDLSLNFAATADEVDSEQRHAIEEGWPFDGLIDRLDSGDTSLFDANLAVIAAVDDLTELTFLVLTIEGAVDGLGETVPDVELDGFDVFHAADTDRVVFNAMTTETSNGLLHVIVTLHGDVEATLDQIPTLHQLVSTDARAADGLMVLRSGPIGDTVQTPALGETVERQLDSTEVTTVEACYPPAEDGALRRSDVALMGMTLFASTTYTAGDESITPIEIGDTTGLLFDIDGGSNDDDLVAVTSSAQRTIVLTIFDSGADVELGFEVLDRLSID